MKEFEYANEHISDREIMFAVASMVIGVGVLSLPKDLAAATKFADGWVVILIGGAIVIFFTWLATNLAVKFPRQSFLDYTTLITTKPVAVILTIIFSLIWIFVAAFQIREIADISREYLFEHTPIEVIALSFFLIVIYAVSGHTVGLLRLNMMFLPIIIFISIIIFILNIQSFDLNHLLPMFKTNVKGFAKGLQTTTLSYGGFSLVLFYVVLIKKPKKTALKAAIGMTIPLALYLLLFFTVISVFGHTDSKNLLYPTIELAKAIDIPGGFFERFESIFYVIWTMAIFNTTAMALDIAVIGMSLIFKKANRMKMILIITPIVYLVSMIPQDFIEVSMLGSYIGLVSFSYTVIVIILLTIIAKLRGVSQVE